MQDVDRPAHVQPLAQPAGARGPWVDVQPLRGVTGSKGVRRIGRHRGRRWNLGEQPAVRPPKPQRPVRLSIDLKAFLVDRSMVPATEQREVRERRRATLSPVADVMALAEAHATAREAAAEIAVLERSA
jgi:hypothetical protein